MTRNELLRIEEPAMCSWFNTRSRGLRTLFVASLVLLLAAIPLTKWLATSDAPSSSAWWSVTAGSLALVALFVGLVLADYPRYATKRVLAAAPVWLGVASFLMSALSVGAQTSHPWSSEFFVVLAVLLVSAAWAAWIQRREKNAK